jgi:type VI secretion system secreted protein Hcp
MSTDTACQFDGVEGESTRKGLEKWIEVLSWRWGVSQPSGGGAGGGSGKGKAVPGDFEFTHSYDKASPVLAKACAGGKHFPKVVFKSSKAGEGQKTFLETTMKEVLVTSVQPGGSAGGDITEHVSCSYKDIEFAYKPQDDKGGLGGEVKFGWNLGTLETR